VTLEQSSVVVEVRGRGAAASRQDGGIEQRPSIHRGAGIVQRRRGPGLPGHRRS
jgi:hypothetical protein